MTILERCAAVAEALTRVEVVRKNAHQRASIEQRSQEWTSRMARLSSTRVKASWLGLEPSSVPAFTDAWQKVRGLAGTAANRLAESEDAASLSADASWVQLLSAAGTANDALEDAVKCAWRALIAEGGAVEPPSALKSRIAQTPRNNEGMSSYEQHHAAYARLVSQGMPKTADDPRALADALRGCRNAFHALEFDVPTEVEMFFKAVNAGGANLELLTPVVLDWLQRNSQVARYVVKGVSR